MGGEHNTDLRFRLPEDLKKRFAKSCRVGAKVSQADVIRSFIQIRVEFVEEKGRQPHSLRELCRWYLRRGK